MVCYRHLYFQCLRSVVFNVLRDIETWNSKGFGLAGSSTRIAAGHSDGQSASHGFQPDFQRHSQPDP
jgi:hypothetical protein